MCLRASECNCRSIVMPSPPYIHQYQMDMKTAVDNLYQEHKNLLPRQEVIFALANTEELMTIEEWLATYDSHTDLILDEGSRVGVLSDVTYNLTYARTLTFRPRLADSQGHSLGTLITAFK